MTTYLESWLQHNPPQASYTCVCCGETGVEYVHWYQEPDSDVLSPVCTECHVDRKYCLPPTNYLQSRPCDTTPDHVAKLAR